ncbi:bidirectional sugar transporter SWEET5 [Mercurialis annua]|uniref:bidirectional sugar transporter SWEET5 n=1 Tax=Mercurialis annua TaxID=3986 RepID=UPI00215F42CB|nr:bidirectional sugar transporter SWEET5 [Mercurialis annua]
MFFEDETARTVVGIIGNVVSLVLFLSPIPTFRKIVKQKAVQEFKPDPYLATVFNCAMWTFYGLPFVKEDSLLVVTINSVGLVIEFVYVAIFFYFATSHKRRKIGIVLALELVAMVAVVLIAMGLMHTNKTRSLFVGILCIILNVIMYSSPLTVMRMVIRTKSVKYMPIYLSLASLANGVIWVAYSLLRFDINIVIPNGLGALAGIVQIILYATYYKTTNWDEDSTQNRAEVQLPASNV